MLLAKLAIVFVALVTWFGFIGPYCVSAPNTELVLGWALATLVGVVTLANWIKGKFTNTKKENP